MADEKIRLGGMALQNGVLVHGPTAWAVAVRTPDGELRSRRATRSVRGADVTNPLLRGPARLLDALLLLPRIRRAQPAARLPFERPVVLGAMVATAVAVRLVRTSGLRPVAKELLGERALARAGDAGAPRLRAGGLPRRRAHLRSAPTSTASRAGRSTSAVGRISSGRCCSRRRSAPRSPRVRPEPLRGRGARGRPPSARWPPRPSSSPGWSGTRSIRLHGRSPAPATRCSTLRDRRSRPRTARGRRGGARAPASSSRTHGAEHPTAG